MEPDQQTLMELDIKLANVYASLIEIDMELDDYEREQLYMVLRLAFLEGQQDVFEKLQPALDRLASAYGYTTS